MRLGQLFVHVPSTADSEQPLIEVSAVVVSTFPLSFIPTPTAQANQLTLCVFHGRQA